MAATLSRRWNGHAPSILECCPPDHPRSVALLLSAVGIQWSVLLSPENCWFCTTNGIACFHILRRAPVAVCVPANTRRLVVSFPNVLQRSLMLIALTLPVVLSLHYATGNTEES